MRHDHRPNGKQPFRWASSFLSKSVYIGEIYESPMKSMVLKNWLILKENKPLK